MCIRSWAELQAAPSCWAAPHSQTAAAAALKHQSISRCSSLLLLRVSYAAAERGPDPYSLKQGSELVSETPGQHHDVGHGFHDEASIVADRMRRDFGREPSSNARPRGGVDAIPSESAMPGAAKARSGGRGARKSA